MRTEELSELWRKLAEEASGGSHNTSRVYRSLGPSDMGVRASFVVEEQTIEVLVDVPRDWQQLHHIPEWKGLRLRILREQIGPRKSHQLSVSPADTKCRDVFVHFAGDLIQMRIPIQSAR